MGSESKISSIFPREPRETARVWCEVDLSSVAHNVRKLVGRLKQGAALMAIVKSEAYGHGAVAVSRAALAAGASALGINEIAEGVALRDSGIRAPILLLTSCLPDEMPAGIDAALTFSVSSIDEAKALADRSRALLQGARRGQKTRVHLMVDTGIGRGGFGLDEVWPAVDYVNSERTLELEGIFTHFSSAEEPDPAPTRQQTALFRNLLHYCEERRMRFKVRHAANSAGTVFHANAQLDMVRCGVLLHGMRAWPAERDQLELLPTLSLYTRIHHIGWRKAGWPVGYNRMHVCPKDSLLATLPVGYSDGYRRALTGRSNVIVRGVQVPVVGTISMNCIVADVTALTNAPGGPPDVGELVTLIGGTPENRISVEEIADKSGTIPYVVTTQLGANVERRYRGLETLPALEPGYEMRSTAQPEMPASKSILPPLEEEVPPARVASA
ncbi:MAG TPA: alanine racemase [Planctomycetota bacterium]|jgi:alanine racemase